MCVNLCISRGFETNMYKKEHYNKHKCENDIHLGKNSFRHAHINRLALMNHSCIFIKTLKYVSVSEFSHCIWPQPECTFMAHFVKAM